MFSILSHKKVQKRKWFGVCDVEALRICAPLFTGVQSFLEIQWRVDREGNYVSNRDRLTIKERNSNMSSAEIVRLRDAVTERDHACGPATAPVTLVEYGNFECIHCKAAFPVIKQVQKLLGDNLRFVFRHFPTVRIHAHAMRAAEAAEAAGAQAKFWEMHDQLFTHQQFLEDQYLSRYAKHINLDVEKFNADLRENVFLKQIQSDYERALFDEHVTGTPTLYINDVRYSGSTNLEDMLVAIKEADTGGQINLPERGKGLRRLLRSFQQRAGK